jgi:hypothetical protein
MGDRAVVVFVGGGQVSPAVYLHAHGGLVPELLVAAVPRMRKGDVDYAAARFIGECHERIPGALSLGCSNITAEQLAHENFSPGDAGVFLVNVFTGDVRQWGGYRPEYVNGLVWTASTESRGTIDRPMTAKLNGWAEE